MFFKNDEFEYADRMAKHSFTAGITALASSIVCFIYPVFGFLFGSLGITFACISRPKKGKLATPALVGILCSAAGMAINFCVVGMTVLVLLLPGNFKMMMNDMNTIYEENTDVSFADTMQSVFGVDITPYLE